MRLNTFIICMSIAYFELNIASDLMSYRAAAHNTEMPYQFSAKKNTKLYRLHSSGKYIAYIFTFNIPEIIYKCAMQTTTTKESP